MIGTTISHYRILEELGRGGMGVVYRAEDTRLRRQVALKFLAPDLTRNPEAKERFIHEARAASALDHPNICNVHEIDETEDGSTFLVMALYEGETLRERIARGPLPEREVLRICRQLAEGLARAHEAGVVHRDLKPANIILTADGTAKIVDFGLAKLASQTRLTRTGTTMGTVAYMSPEQARGDVVDPRSDIWSLGVILYEAITGRLPFRGENEQAVIHSILTVDPEPVALAASGAGGRIADIVSRCLQKNPTERYCNARQLSYDLEASNPIPETVSLAPGRRRRVGRKLLAGLVLAVVAASTVTVVWSVWQAREPSPPDPASRGDPSWILVADFETTPPDSELAVAARELVNSALAQSDLVTPLTREQIRTALENAGKPRDSTLQGELAHEIAFRTSCPVYVAGRVDKVLSGYSIVLNVLDAEDESLVHSVNRIARGEADLISALDELGRDLRRTLGENEEVVRASRPLLDVVTPSFEAYKLFLEARDNQIEGDYDRGMELAREALALDPDFAAVWTMIAAIKWNEGDNRGAESAIETALANRGRMTNFESLQLEANRHFIQWDLDKARKDYERLLARYPNRDNGNNLGVILSFLGRKKEALAAYQRVEASSPLSNPIYVHNRFNALMGSHRLEEAREMIPEFTGKHWTQIRARWELALAEGDWTGAEHQAIALQSESALDPFNLYLARATLAILDATRGRVHRASDTLSVMCDDDVRQLVHLSRIFTRDFQHALCMARGSVPAFPVLRTEYDTTATASVWRLVWAAESNRLDLVDSLLVVVNALDRPTRRRYRQAIPYARACILAHSGNWKGAAEELRTIASSASAEPVGFLAVDWLLGVALAQLRDLPSAVAQFERVQSGERCWTWWDWLRRPIYRPYALQKLVLLYSRMGREDDARRCWEALRTTMTDPDPELQPMLEEARASLEELQRRT